MVSYFIIFLILGGYLLFGIIGIKILDWKLNTVNPITRIIIFSFFDAFVFGIGAAGGGGHPGFALPCPIIIAIFISNTQVFLNSIIIPLVFWWSIIFIFLITKLWLKKRKLKNETN